jgi:hypothetical protein
MEPKAVSIRGLVKQKASGKAENGDGNSVHSKTWMKPLSTKVPARPNGAVDGCGSDCDEDAPPLIF